MTTHLKSLPESARVWIYQAPRSLTVAEREYVTASLENFTEDWHAHGKSLRTGYALMHRRFIVLAVDESQQPASGCSIDDSLALIRKLSEELNIDFLDRMQVAFRSENNMVVSVPLNEFKGLIESGDITAETIVFNNLITDLHSFYNRWEVPARESWHARYFKKVSS